MQKNSILNHSPSLFDAQGTKAFALEESYITKYVEKSKQG